MGKALVLIGLGVAGLGVLIMLGLPFGRMPGDIFVRRGNFSFYFPITTGLLVSAAISLIVWLLRK